MTHQGYLETSKETGTTGWPIQRNYSTNFVQLSFVQGNTMWAICLKQSKSPTQINIDREVFYEEWNFQ